MSQERYTGIVVLLLAVLLFAVDIPLGVDSPIQIDNAALAPDLWPKIIVHPFCTRDWPTQWPFFQFLSARRRR